MLVLVVDDSRIMRGIIKNSLAAIRAFREAQYLDAGDGVAAWEALTAARHQGKAVDLLLVDWNMPRLNGIELVRRIRAEADWKRLPIIMITSEAAKYHVIEAVKAGVNDYLVKPVSERLLREKIQRLFPEGR